MPIPILIIIALFVFGFVVEALSDGREKGWKDLTRTVRQRPAAVALTVILLLAGIFGFHYLNKTCDGIGCAGPNDMTCVLYDFDYDSETGTMVCETPEGEFVKIPCGTNTAAGLCPVSDRN